MTPRSTSQSATTRTPLAGHVGWIERLHDGTLVGIRPISERDAELEFEFLSGLSPEARSLRFLGLIREPSIEVARELTQLDPASEAAVIAVVPHEGRERQIGAAQFHVSPQGDACDCSVTVADAWQKRGVGTLLMHYLIEAARRRGIQHMQAFAPAPSESRRRLASRLGFQRCLDPDDPAVTAYRLELP